MGSHPVDPRLPRRASEWSARPFFVGLEARESVYFDARKCRMAVTLVLSRASSHSLFHVVTY